MNELNETVPVTPDCPVDDASGINIRSFVKIYDPETQEVFVTNNDA